MRVSDDYNLTHDANNDNVHLYQCDAVGNAISHNTWCHLVGTYDASTGITKLYVNGTLITTTDEGGVHANEHPQTNCPFTVGAYGWDTEWGGSAYYYGLIDNVVVYNRVLTSKEVAGRYNKGVGTESFATYVAP